MNLVGSDLKRNVMCVEIHLVASPESVTRAVSAASVDALLGDPILIELAYRADIDDRVEIPITLNLRDGSSVSGIVSSDDSMMQCCDQPLADFFAEDRVPGARADVVEDFEKMRPTLGGRGLHAWWESLKEGFRAAQRSAQGDRPSYDWSDVDEADVLTLASLSKRSAITLRNARVEGSGTTRSVSVLRVTIAHVSTWWVTPAAGAEAPEALMGQGIRRP